MIWSSSNSLSLSLQPSAGGLSLRLKSLRLMFRFTLDSTFFRECGTSLPTVPKLGLNVVSMLVFNVRSSTQPADEF